MFWGEWMDGGFERNVGVSSPDLVSPTPFFVVSAN